MDSDIADVRAFNRFYTRQIGLLEEHVARSRFSLPEGRLLYEVATRGRTTGAELGRELGVDRAYISRMLQKFVAEGLVVSSPSETDRRSNDLTLTAAGEAAFRELDSATSAGIAALLAPLDPARRQALLAAMQSIRAILGEGTERGPVVLRPHRIGELGWLIHRQGLLYNLQYGWNGDFEALIARIYNEYHFAPETPPKALWVAEQNGAVAGSIFCMPSEGLEGSAQLRMLYVEPEARGQGVGGMLVDQCVAFARGAGYERVRLWTHSVQEAARKVYARAGFTIVEEWDHRSFGKNLHAEIWELRF
ncbi:MAG TPA: MarR family transcriptional regulator [Alphaproteobacteria bacterium]|nr:MarR family transcriptional regulator [Alphaproteobacteria bacterium]